MYRPRPKLQQLLNSSEQAWEQSGGGDGGGDGGAGGAGASAGLGSSGGGSEGDIKGDSGGGGTWHAAMDAVSVHPRMQNAPRGPAPASSLALHPMYVPGRKLQQLLNSSEQAWEQSGGGGAMGEDAMDGSFVLKCRRPRRRITTLSTRVPCLPCFRRLQAGPQNWMDMGKVLINLEYSNQGAIITNLR